MLNPEVFYCRFRLSRSSLGLLQAIPELGKAGNIANSAPRSTSYILITWIQLTFVLIVCYVLTVSERCYVAQYA